MTYFVMHVRDPSTINLKLNALDIQATFGMGFSSYKNAIQISDTTEESFYTKGEWSEYIGAFFNKEKEVVDLADLSRERYNFHTCFYFIYACQCTITVARMSPI